MRQLGASTTFLLATAGFTVGGMNAPVRMLPYESYYFLPLALYAATGLLILGSFIFKGPEHPYGRYMMAAVSCFLIAYCFSLSWTAIHHNALWTRWVTFGILPTNDASDFLDTALTLLGSGTFETPRGRPFSDAAWAGALALFNLDLFHSTMFFTGLAALGVVMGGLSVHRALGSAAAVVLAACLFDYIHEHIGGVVSEIPGFILGMGAFAWMVQAAKTRSRVSFLVGIVFLSLAMSYRIGAVLILPALLIWSYRTFGSGRTRWGVPAAAAALLLCTFLVNSLVTSHVTPTSGGSFVNAIDSWYATVVEGDLALGRRAPSAVLPGTRWVQIYEDFPEIKKLQGFEWVERKRQVFFGALGERPLSAMVGGVLEIKNYLLKRDVVAFIDFKPLRYLFMLLLLLGVWVCVNRIRRDKDPLAEMVLWANLGILVSQPFLYGGEVRVPAPTIAFTLMLASFGVTAAKPRPRVHGAAGLATEAPAFWAGGAAATVMFLSALGIAQGGEWSASKVNPLPCPLDARSASFSVPMGGGLAIGPAMGFAHSLPQSTLEKGLRQQESLFKWGGRFVRTIFDEPLGSKSSWLLETLADSPGKPLFAGVVLDRISGRPIQVLIQEPRSHRDVRAYCISRDDKGGVARAVPQF